MSDNNSNENNSTLNNKKILALGKKNNQMLILERSLYILKNKFEIHKKELEIIYEKYRHKNYKKLKCINVDYLYPLYDEIMKTTKFNLIPYTNSKEVISADLLIELNKEKRKMVLKSLEKFTLENIEKYNRIYYDEKMRKKKLLEEEEKKKKEEEEEKKKEEPIFNSEVKIVKMDKRGKIIYTFEEMLENNKEFEVGKDMISSIDEDDAIILDNNKLLYTDVFRLIIADFLQNGEPNGTYNIAIISMGEDLDGKEDSKLNEDVKKLYDNEIIKINTNIVKIDPNEEKKEKLKSLLLELMNIENQITIYQNLFMQKTTQGDKNIKHIINFLKKLKEEKIVIQKKIEQLKLELNGQISILNNDIKTINSNFSLSSKKIHKKYQLNKDSKSTIMTHIEIDSSFSSSHTQRKKIINKVSSKKYANSSIKTNIRNNSRFISEEINENNVFQTNINREKYKHNYNKGNFYYNYGIKEPKTKEEFRKNNLLEIFYFYTKQHSFIGQTPTFEEILKSEEHLDLAEFGKFCVDFKILMKSQKIAEIFKKNANKSKEMNFEGFVETLKKLSISVNEEKKQYLMERIKLSKLKLKEIKESKQKENINKTNENEENLIEKKNEGEGNNLEIAPEEKKLEENNEKKEELINNINNKNEYISTNMKHYHKYKLRIHSQKKIQNKKVKLVKAKSKYILTETEEECEEKISKLKIDYNKLKEKSESQLEEEFYQYLEIDEPNLYRKKMVGYLYPFHFRENVSRFPLKSVLHPVKRDPNVEKEYHKMLEKRHELMIKEKEIKQTKEKNILFEKRKKQFEENNRKLVEKLNKKNDYKQFKLNEEDYQKEKMDRITWEIIQDSDYDTFLINDMEKTNQKFDNVFSENTDQLEGDFAEYLNNVTSRKKFNENHNFKTYGNGLKNNISLNNNILSDNNSPKNKMSSTEINNLKFNLNFINDKNKNNKRYGISANLNSNK